MPILQNIVFFILDALACYMELIIANCAVDIGQVSEEGSLALLLL